MRRLGSILRPFVSGATAKAPPPALIWEGVHASFAEVPTHGAGFLSREWLDATRAATERAIAASRGSAPCPLSGHHALLAGLVAALRRSGPVRVVDFGGAMGLGFAQLLSAVGQHVAVEYHVVDNEPSCREGAALFGREPRLLFHEAPPSRPGAIDILHLGGVLQFVADYRGLVAALLALRPRYVLLGMLPAGHIPTFATAQRNVPGSSIPAWFFNLDELNRLFRGDGYETACVAPFERRFDMSNFPDTHRLDHQCHALLDRATASP